MSGLIYLTTNGHMNTLISGCPTYSHFLSNYKRSTDFSFDIMEKKSREKPVFGKTITFDIPTDEGDLLNNIAITISLTSDRTHNTPFTYNNTGTDLGSFLIERAELLIGGQIIEVITSEYIRIHQSLYNTYDDQRRALRDLTGHSWPFSYSEDDSEIKFLFDLPFYFYRNTSRNIPLCALKKHSVQIRIKICERDAITNSYAYDLLEKGLYPGVNIEDVKKEVLNTSLYVKYGYISDIERNYIMSSQIEHVIEQLQVSKFKLEHTPENFTRTIRTNFKNPVKEMYFTRSMYTSPDTYRNLQFKNLSLKFNGNTVFDEDGRYFRYLQPYFNHTGLTWIREFLDKEIHTYSFAIDPENNFPIGHVNMSRIINQEITFTFDDTWWTPGTHSFVYVYARSYNILCFRNGLGGLKF